jgi:hypothetical protein
MTKAQLATLLAAIAATNKHPEPEVWAAEVEAVLPADFLDPTSPTAPAA